MNESVDRKPLPDHELAERFGWWWHDSEFRKNPYEYSIRRLGPAVPWKGQREIAFWTWELLRRFDPSLGSMPAWEVGMYEEILLLQVGGFNNRVVCRSSEPEWPDATAPGWSRVPCNVQWNLRATDAELVRAFVSWVQQWRGEQGIKKPRKNAGQRRRPLSWRWPELLDIDGHACRVLNDSERKMLSEARLTAAKLRTRFFDTLRAVRSGERILSPIEGRRDPPNPPVFPRISIPE